MADARRTTRHRSRRRALSDAAAVIGDSLEFGALLTDKNGRVLHCNDRALTLLRAADFNDLQSRLAAVFGDDLAFPLLRGAEGESNQGGAWMRDGESPVWLRWWACPAQGLADSALLLLADETARKLSEEELKLEQQRYLLVLDATSHALFEWDLQLNKSRFAGPWHELFGLRPGSDAVGLRFVRESMLEADRQRVWPRLEQCAESGELFREEFRLTRADGRLTWLEMTGRSVRDAQGAPWRMIGNLQDIGQRKQLAQALKLEVIGRMAGGIAHDFNNLLTIMQGHAELLEMQGVKGVQPILDAARRGALLTRQLLTFARRQVVMPQVLELNAAIAAEADLLERALGDEIEIAFTPSPRPAHVRLDPGQLQQVLTNLAVNAREATPHGGRFELSVAVEGAVTLRVRDTGRGIEPAHLPHVFEPFFTTRENEGGTGLGLATVRSIIEHAGGTIDVESAPGQGACFTIVLPTAVPASGAPADQPHAPSGGSATILLVDDNPDVRLITRKLLERAGFRVIEAIDGEHALHNAAHQPIDLLLTDVHMPRLNGLDLADRIAQLYPGVKVAFHTADTEDDALRARVQSLRALYLQKPFPPATMVQRLHELLSR
ncbi:MAG: response regulator [Planctomycetes bacterium]|nr:response regulator [Planctomycetota bacterium]MCW8135188.1 response regulator [Planctomycetota bacterium]